ncbi:MAG TPA: HEAT repeat domain-containing protein [Pirellulales bacterium]|nr:HEAT repeat domain-containing protein [Pirellulales bacterium]
MKSCITLFVAALLGVILTATCALAQPASWLSVNDEASKKLTAQVAAALSQALWDENTDARQAAMFALEAMDAGAAPAIPTIAERLRDVDAYLRADSSRILTKLDAPAVPSVIAALYDPDPRVRELAARTFIEMKTTPTSAIPALTQLLWDCVPDVRQAAIEALEAMGPAAKPAIDALVQRLRDPDAYIRGDASRTLVELGPETLPSMLPLLRDGDPRVRQLTARTIEEIEFNLTSGNYIDYTKQ